MNHLTARRLGSIAARVAFSLVTFSLAHGNAHASTHIDDVPAFRTDVYSDVTFQGGRTAHVSISGDGDTDLDLFVYDQNENLICESTSSGDDEDCSFTPRWTGPFTIKVRNLGRVSNIYSLSKE